MVIECGGKELDALVLEKVKIYRYFIENGKLSPGNKMFHDHIKIFNMIIGIAPQVYKDVDTSIFIELFNYLETNFKNKRYGKLEELVVGYICILDEISHLLPERMTKITRRRNLIEIEIAMDHNLYFSLNIIDFMRLFLDKFRKKLRELQTKIELSYFDIPTFIKDLNLYFEDFIIFYQSKGLA